MNKTNEVITYLENLPANDRRVSTTLRQQILNTTPGLEERLSRGVPFFYYRGKRAVGFRSSKTHLSLFIMEGNVLKDMHRAITDYDHGPTVVKFSAKTPLPESLINKLVKARVSEIDQSISKKS